MGGWFSVGAPTGEIQLDCACASSEIRAATRLVTVSIVGPCPLWVGSREQTLLAGKPSSAAGLRVLRLLCQRSSAKLILSQPHKVFRPLAEVVRVTPSGNVRQCLIRLLAAALSGRTEATAGAEDQDADDAMGAMAWIGEIVRVAQRAEQAQVNQGDAYSFELQALLSLHASLAKRDAVMW